jgi:crotonobetainyl-CoA:carnitine CoA-transferase CaiB-like acyl-CoA transferase
MGGVMDGIRVVEVALYGLVPTAGAVLAEWGADVVKVEHPDTGDPIRGLNAFGVPPGTGGVTYLLEVFNRGKRSVGIDLGRPEGHALLLELVAGADVFLTNFLGDARQRLGIDSDDLLAVNPRLIYGLGTGHGLAGPDAGQGGFDGISYWSRTGAAVAAIPGDYEHPIPLPGPAFGDIQTGLHLAGGIAAALFRRERTGAGAVVDTSLLASGLWAMQASMAGAAVSGRDCLPRTDRRCPANPLVNTYRTADGRFVSLAMLEADRYWPGFCQAIGRPDLAADPRFATARGRQDNLAECVAALDAVFAERDLAGWQDALRRQEGQWSVIQTPAEALEDPQAHANGMVQVVKYDNGATLPLVNVPTRIDGETAVLRPAPELGAHTEEVVLELGKTWDRIIELKEVGAIS